MLRRRRQPEPKGCCVEKQGSSNLAVWTEGQRTTQRFARRIEVPFLEGAEVLRAFVLSHANDPGVDVFTIVNNLPWDVAFTARLEEGWSDASFGVFRSSARKELGRLGVPVRRSKAETDDIDKIALTWIEANSLSRAVGLTDVSKEAVRQVLMGGIRQNLGIRPLITDIADVVGLTPKQSFALMRRRDKAIAEGVTGTRLDKFVARERRRFLRLRSEAIARTETIRARTEGTAGGWQIARDEGVLPGGMQKIWIANGACKICEAIVEEGPVGLTQPFFSPEQNQFISGPPAHPNCRCSVGLVDPEIP